MRLRSNGISLSKSLARLLKNASNRSISYFDRINRATIVSISGDKRHGKFVSIIPDTFSISHAPNGGYITATAIDAARQLISFPHPLAISCHFINKSLENVEATISVKVLQVSKSTASVDIEISQEHKLRAKFLATFGDLQNMKGLNHKRLDAPNLPPRDECVHFNSSMFNFSVTNLDRISICLPKKDHFVQSVLKGKEGTVAAIEGWGRFTDPDGGICPRSLAYFLDAFPPPVLNLSRSTWVPTLEYSVHFWNTSTLQQPNGSEQWLRLRYVSPYVKNGLLYTDAEAWSEDGSVLLASSRQLARVL